ncbi:MAG TPA: DUF6677 family protein [Candidatus Acidoferrales bacterium]|nr:DUF6677 family protein [Candidatus Acidoferrales bacterium]
MNETPNVTPEHESFSPPENHEPEQVTPRPPKTAAASSPLSIAVASWLVPGLGHLLLRRTGRAIVFFIAVGGLAIAGSRMRGNVFPPRSADPFGTLGFWADAASGIFYLLARAFERAGPDVSRAAGDYGTRFIAAAGIVNLIAAFDAYEIAAGRRS